MSPESGTWILRKSGQNAHLTPSVLVEMQRPGESNLIFFLRDPSVQRNLPALHGNWVPGFEIAFRHRVRLLERGGFQKDFTKLCHICKKIQLLGGIVVSSRNLESHSWL